MTEFQWILYFILLVRTQYKQLQLKIHLKLIPFRQYEFWKLACFVFATAYLRWFLTIFNCNGCDMSSTVFTKNLAKNCNQCSYYHFKHVVCDFKLDCYFYGFVNHFEFLFLCLNKSFVVWICPKSILAKMRSNSMICC